MTSPTPFSDDELEQLRARADRDLDGPVKAWRDDVRRLLATVEKANEERDDERELSARLVDERIEVDTRVTRLREALFEYGRHKHDCEDRLWLVGPRAEQNVPRPPCSCGYIDALSGVPDPDSRRALASHGETEGASDG